MDTVLGLATKYFDSKTNHNHEETVRKAAADHPEDESYYAKASEHVARYTSEHRPPSDEEAEEAKSAHKKIYKEGGGNREEMENMGADAVGGAVATQAIQKFLGGGGGNTDDLIALAMKEATKLLGGDAEPGFKQQVVQRAAMMAFKSQLEGKEGGGGGGGDMMKMLGKFL